MFATVTPAPALSYPAISVITNHAAVNNNKGIIHPPSLSPPFYSTSFCSNSWFLCSRDIILGGQAAAANPHLATRDTLIQS
jgi:hypothetical protein